LEEYRADLVGFAAPLIPPESARVKRWWVTGTLDNRGGPCGGLHCAAARCSWRKAPRQRPGLDGLAHRATIRRHASSAATNVAFGCLVE
jgi:hypothetical protein